MTETAAAPGKPAAPPGKGKLGGAIPPWAEKAFIPVFFVAFLAFPFIVDPDGGLMFDMTLALAYVVMALGLNIIVGFAGLLDLGYVAFFAIGAYTMGWFGSRLLLGRQQRGGHPRRRLGRGGQPARHPLQLHTHRAGARSSSPRSREC